MIYFDFSSLNYLTSASEGRGSESVTYSLLDCFNNFILCRSCLTFIPCRRVASFVELKFYDLNQSSKKECYVKIN
eukprot:snap_masked-scaffold_7-processed-gene-11.31-mRNA-1 protein AED:1.00 eAED:1.00 QI:0/0/0/0/1/1/3/0/74